MTSRTTWTRLLTRPRPAAAAVFVLLALGSCFEDGLGPNAARRGNLAIAPVFQRGAALVPFDRAHVVAIRTLTQAVALDTTITVAASTDSFLSLSLRIPLEHNTESFSITLQLVNAAGDTVFRAGPITVTTTAGNLGGNPTPLPIVYTGVGSNATRVVISTDTSLATFGGSVGLTATAYDAANAPLPGTPIAWSCLDLAMATVPDQGAGTVNALNVRGTARVVAQLLTGPSDTAAVIVQPPLGTPTSTGGGQTGPIGTQLAQPLVATMLGTDGLPVRGVAVSFSVVSGGGSVVPASAVSDANGKVQTAWTLGSSLGAQSVQLTATGLATALVWNATATAGVPTQLVVIAQPTNTAQLGTITPAIQVAVRDAVGNTVTTATDAITVAITPGTGAVGATLGGTKTVPAASGIASFSNLTVDLAANGYTLTFTAAGLSSAVSASFNILSTAPQSLAFTTQPPASTTAGVAFGTVVEARDGFGNRATSFTGQVSLQLTSANGDTVFGTRNATAVAGVATFAGLAVGKAGSYTISATASALTGATSSSFAITAASATTLAIASGNNQSATPSTQLPQPIVVKAADAFGNGVSGIAVTFAITAGAGTLGTPSATTDASGNASSTWTLGAGTGIQTATATATGLAGSPITFSANNTGGITSTVMTPQLDTLTALNATFQLSAQARDASNNPVAGSFTWVSRAPAIATVNGSGLVTAVANGTTYVVATEAGGTRDSALIVVEQRLATINVTPGTRNIYLTQSFTFTATAVDGLGSPIAGITTFTWTSTAPAVASVDAAGLVSALGLGSAQIRATSGAVIGVANISVITPITRIAVVVDTVGAATTDTFTLTSLGLTRSYRAIAHDTLDAVMPSVTFTWASTNGSVAVLDLVTGTTARATSAANGVTTIQATAQGFTSAPGAALTVAQVLASVELTPAAATIGVTGTVGLVARGKDANNRYISGGTFTFASDAPAFATVNATTGVVTGVSLGAANITAASGVITSNPSVITVSASVPPAISFGRDTLSVGRGSSTSIPILLSTPSGSPLTVNLAVADTFAFWSTASVTILAGQTSINATLNGRNAGTTTVTATDAGAVYASASAVLAVTATMRLTSGGYAINATDIVSTQVLLSDPSPAGGTFVTFSYSVPGIAAISPDPAFIPAGQLAADIQIRGLAAGTTNITPSAIGVNGTPSSFTAYAAVLTLPYSQLRLGQGQYEPNYYVYTPTYGNVPVQVTMTSSDTNVVTVTPNITIPSNSNIAYFTTTAKGLGTATVTATAPGWTSSGAMTVFATTPHVAPCCGGNLFTTSPQQNLTVYAEDSTFSAHYRTNSLVVRLSSRDTFVMKVLDTLVTIPPNQYYTSAARVIPGGLGGSTYIIATASGHTPDSVLYTVQGPALNFGFSSNRIGAGQEDYNLYVYTPNGVTAPLVVTLGNPDPAVVGVPATVTIPTGSNIGYFTVRGLVQGSVTLTATAPGYQAATASYTVTTPRIVACCSYTFNNFGTGAAITLYSADSVGNAHYRSAPLSVSLVSTDPAVFLIDSATVTIDSGFYYNNRAQMTPVGVGVAKVVFAAAGHIVQDSLTTTVVTPQLGLSFSSAYLGRRQRFDPNGNGLYVYTPNTRATPLVVTVTQTNGTADSLTTTTPTIGAGTNIVFFDAMGLATGKDTLTFSAPGYLPVTAYITVTTPRFVNCCMPGATTTTNPPIGITVYATDSIGNAHYTMDTVVVAAVSSDSTVIQPSAPFFRILKNAYYASPTVNVTGPGTASVTYSDSAGTGYLPTTTGTVTVTGPSLTLAIGTPMLGMRQRGGTSTSYVYTPNAVATPLVVNLLSTSTRVATVPASVTILAGSNIAYFEVTAQDTVGTIQIQATATGYSASSGNVQVTAPRFVVSVATQLNTTSAPSVITIYATDANGSAHYTTEDVVVTLVSSAQTVASIDSSTVTIVNGNYYTQAARWSPGQVGTAQLSASDPRAVYYQYGTGTANVAVVTPSLNFSVGTTYLGIGQYQDYNYVYTPDNQATPLTVTFTHSGTQRASTFDNLTQTPITGVTIGPPENYYKYFRLAGLSTGTDSLIASATSPLHNPDTAYTVVGPGLIDPLQGWPGTIKAGDSVLVTLYARDPAGNAGRYVLAATTFTLAPNANIEFHSGGAVITSATIPVDGYFVQFYLKGVSAGTGSVTITATNYVTYSNTVTVTP